MKDKVSPFVFEFLNDLSQNNSREWFANNKERWEAVRADFLEFVDGIMPDLYKMDSTIGIQSADKCMYRIYRDLRFSADKTPFKTHLAVYIATGGVKQHGRPGYYLHIQNDNSSLGGGIYMPQPNVLAAIRKEIFYNVDEFRDILNNEHYRHYFDGLWQIDTLKQLPKGFPKDFEYADFLKNKHYASMHNFDNDTATSSGFRDYVLSGFRATYPLNKFIIDAMN